MDTLSALHAELDRRSALTEPLPLARHLQGHVGATRPTRSLCAAAINAAPALQDAMRQRTTTGAGVPAFCADPVGHVAARTEQWLHAHNQFLQIGSRIRAAYHAHLTRVLRRLVTMAPHINSLDPVAQLFEQHEHAVRQLVLGVAGPRPIEVANAAYTPELQLRILGLDVRALSGRVLDLGCGVDGRLVRHLRDHGVRAWGIDRYADAAWCRAASWPEALLHGDRRWRTVVSHHAFSLHFLHHHLNPSSGRALGYATAYRELLDHLPPGGTLAYAPALPFIEQAVDRHRFAVAHPTAATLHVAGMEIPLATQIRKLVA